MKIAKEIKRLVEDEQPKQLSADELKKFWKAMQDYVFKESKNVKEDDLGLFLDGVEIDFDPIDQDFLKNPKKYIKDIRLKAISPKDIVSEILNAHVLPEESTEEQDEQALQYLIKNLKGESVYVYGETEFEDGRVNIEIEYDGTVKIKNLKYDTSKEIIVVTDAEVVKIRAVQQ